MKALTDSEIRADRLRSEIVQLEAQYDGMFPPGPIRSSKASDGKLLPSIRPFSGTMSAQRGRADLKRSLLKVANDPYRTFTRLKTRSFSSRRPRGHHAQTHDRSRFG